MPTDLEKLKRINEDVEERLEELKAQPPRKKLTQESLDKMSENLKLIIEEQKNLGIFFDDIENSNNNLTLITTLFNTYELSHKPYSLKMFFYHLIVVKNEIVLHFALENKWFESIKWDEGLISIYTPLYIALEKSNLSIQKLLISYGASLNNPYSHKKEKEKHTIKNNCLFFEEHVANIEELIKFEKVLEEKKYLTNNLTTVPMNSNTKDKIKV
jgi:hypothetical protein